MSTSTRGPDPYARRPPTRCTAQVRCSTPNPMYSTGTMHYTLNRRPALPPFQPLSLIPLPVRTSTMYCKHAPAAVPLPHPCTAGMRQQVYRYHAQRPGYRIVTHSATYINDMATAKFCLAPTGGGHGKRQVRGAREGGTARGR